MTTYRGLCINGPLSGRSAAAETHRMRIEIPQKLAPFGQSKIPEPLLIDTFEYVFTVIESLDVGSRHEQRRGFWIPSDVRGDRTLYVIDELSIAYEKGGAA